jgi:hypothetical protein
MRFFVAIVVMTSALIGCTSQETPGRLQGPTFPPDPPAPPVPASFELACDNGPARITYPARAQVACTITPKDGFRGTVAFTCSNEPAWVECGFDPAQVDVTGTAPVTANFGFRQMNVRAEPGSYTVRAMARSADLTRTADVGLTIAEGCAGFRTEASYTGCATRPPGTTCAQFTDGYVWLVRRGGVLGWGDGPTCDGKKVELLMSGAGTIKHLLGTDFVQVDR